jgi:hypothetical protein
LIHTSLMYIHCARILTTGNWWQCQILSCFHKNCDQIWALKITVLSNITNLNHDIKVCLTIKTQQDNAQMYTVVIISLWSSQYIAHSAKILKIGKINIYMKSTFSYLEHVHLLKNGSLTWVAQEQYEDTDNTENPIKPHTTSNLSTMSYTVFCD